MRVSSARGRPPERDRWQEGAPITTSTSTRRTNYRLGAVYALVTATLLAVQEPFSALAARSLSSSNFIGITQTALLMSVPLLILPKTSRRDFVAVFGDVRSLGKLLILFGVGVAGLLLYNIGLSSAHPIITAGVLNLSPFWAAMVAAIVSKKAIPASPLAFYGCFVFAFVGAMAIAWSQIDLPNGAVLTEVLHSIMHSRWIYALPMPVFFALSGTLVYEWFSQFDEGAAVAANFVVSGLILLPTTLVLSQMNPASHANDHSLLAILLLLVGTLASSAAGRVFYQVALAETHNDNGFVTMFFLLTPVISSLISIPLSSWIPDVHVTLRPLFFVGLALVTAPLCVFSAILLRDREHAGDPGGR